MNTAAKSAALQRAEARGAEDGRHEPRVPFPEPLAEPLDAASAWPIEKACSRAYRALRDSGRRPLAAIDLLVIHCTQGSTARGAAAWFANPASRGSAHVCVDSGECFRTLPPSLIPWGAAGVNTRGWHLEFSGYAQWDRAEWLAHRGCLKRGAYKLAVHAKAFGIPLRLLTSSELRNGRKGVITHKLASVVYGGEHWDPGAGFPLDLVLRDARSYRGKL